ncbi:hypothetical protein XENORESO_011445 [Xenotaenia resolanae]|uniref:Uncharacterized protein n=1 Tax=Xenotaenia resolanae TaxID=208358 RepID=A0ABV0VSS9_9TELE
MTAEPQESDGHCGLRASGNPWSCYDISNDPRRSREKSFKRVSFLQCLCSYSHSAAEQTMTGQGGIADISPSMCDNKSVQGWRCVCVFDKHGNFSGHAT